MRNTILLILLVAGASSVIPHHANAGPLTSAEVTKVLNSVSLIDPRNGDRPAAVRDVIKDDLALQTGVKSRSELLFQDNTLTRLGAETFFSFKTGTRDLTLEKGSMLLQVPKGLGGAKIRTAAVTAAITGTTIMMEYVPNQYIKVLVLEGSLRLSRNGVFGDSLVLLPGKLVLMRPDAKRIPDPVDVDLDHIVKTSSLVNFPGADPLPSTGLIQAAIEQQQKQLMKKELIPTNFVMGHGTNLVIASNDKWARVISPGGILNATGGAASSAVKAAAPVISSVGTVVSSPAAATTAVTSSINGLSNFTTSAVGNVASNLLGAASTLPTTSGTAAVDNLVSSTTGSVTQATNNLIGAASPISVSPATSTVDNLLNSTTSSPAAIASNTSSPVSAVTSIAVSSSSQLLSLASNAVPNAAGTVAVVPRSIASSTGSASGASTSASSNPTVSSTSSAAAGPAVNVATAAAPSSSTASSIATSAVPSITSPASAAVNSGVATIASAPTTLASANVGLKR
jgi:FecR protein